MALRTMAARPAPSAAARGHPRVSRSSTGPPQRPPGYPVAFLPLMFIRPSTGFGSFGVATAVDPVHHTTVNELPGFPRPHGKVTVAVWRNTIAIRNDVKARFGDLKVGDHIGLAGSRKGIQYLVVTVFARG